MKHHSQLKEIIQATYQKLDEKLDKRRINIMAWLIIALCMSKTVNFLSLAEKIDRKGKISSHYKRIQRFMKEVPLPMRLVATIIQHMIGKIGKKILIMDRTNWKFGNQKINILMLGIKHNNIAYPLMFKLLNKRGNSNTQERIKLIDDYIAWFEADSIECHFALVS